MEDPRLAALTRLEVGVIVENQNTAWSHVGVKHIRNSSLVRERSVIVEGTGAGKDAVKLFLDWELHDVRDFKTKTWVAIGSLCCSDTDRTQIDTERVKSRFGEEVGEKPL